MLCLRIKEIFIEITVFDIFKSKRHVLSNLRVLPVKNLERGLVPQISRSIPGLNHVLALNAPNILSPLDGAITRI